MVQRTHRLKRHLVFLFVGFTLAGAAARTAALEGNWQTKHQAGNAAAFFSLGAGDGFYLETRSAWYLGRYRVRADGDAAELILDVADGSDTGPVGRRFTYGYEREAEQLTLDTSRGPGIFAGQQVDGRAVFIAVNHDSDEDEDDEYTLYASCFVRASGAMRTPGREF